MHSPTVETDGGIGTKDPATALPLEPDQQPLVGTSLVPVSTDLAVEAQGHPTAGVPPYAQFVMYGLGASLMLSVISFDITDDLARGKWTSVPIDVVASIGCLLFLKLAIEKWRSLKQTSTERDIVVRRQKLFSRIILFGIVFVVIAGIIGFEIGTSGTETNQFIADIQEMSSVGDRISQSRNSAGNTVRDQIAMYKSIERDVEEFGSVLTRLQPEAKIFDEKYPAQHEGNQKTIQAIELGLKWVSLLREQIAVAKDLGQLDSAAQWDGWKVRMQPLLDKERALDRAK